MTAPRAGLHGGGTASTTELAHIVARQKNYMRNCTGLYDLLLIMQAKELRVWATGQHVIAGLCDLRCVGVQGTLLFGLT
jgi:hypothetical protein